MRTNFRIEEEKLYCESKIQSDKVNTNTYPILRAVTQGISSGVDAPKLAKIYTKPLVISKKIGKNFWIYVGVGVFLVIVGIISWGVATDWKFIGDSKKSGEGGPSPPMRIYLKQ